MESATVEENPLPPESLRRSLQARASDLAMLPAVAQEAMEVAQHPDCTADQFASVVERDVKLATDLLSFANSALFACSTPVVNLRQAVVRLGFRKCRNLILGSSAASLMQTLPLQEEWVREILWRHNYITATTCIHLNRAFSLGFGGEEFAAGLLHDFGRLLLALAAPESFPDADGLDFHEPSDLLAHESAVMGTDHCQFGAWFARENGLPAELVAAIQHHHQPEVEHEFQELTGLVAAADHIANHLQLELCPESYVPSENRGVNVLSAFRSENLQTRFQDVAPILIEEILKDLASGQEKGA